LKREEWRSDGKGESQVRENALVPNRVAERSGGNAQTERDVSKTDDLSLEAVAAVDDSPGGEGPAKKGKSVSEKDDEKHGQQGAHM
jgi:hypothetical protein